MNTIEKLISLGQSLWYDNIERRLIESGELKEMIARGDIRGLTANPSIFQKAIGETHDYDSALVPLARMGWDPKKIFWSLAAEDIIAAADLFKSLYEETNGGDGFVSIEVEPGLAHDTQGSLEQAQHLWARIGHPNVMIKIPATEEGIPAIRRAIAAGVNINITLIFALSRYAQVMDAYLSGLEDRVAEGKPVDTISSVASFFVSRVDSKVDKQLPKDSPLRGKAGIANAKLAYAEFLKTFQGERWDRLKAKGAKLQRPLWASTSTKDPAYPDTMYVDNLIGANTVNTVPPSTLKAFKDHGKPDITITKGLDEAQQHIADLEAAGISMDKVTEELEHEGVQAFAISFDSLLDTIKHRRSEALSEGVGK